MSIEKLVTVKVNGKPRACEGDPSYTLGGLQHTAVLDSNGDVAGHDAAGVAGACSFTVLLRAGERVQEFINALDATIELKYKTGKTVTFTGMRLSNNPQVSGGRVELQWEGKPGTEKV